MLTEQNITDKSAPVSSGPLLQDTFKTKLSITEGVGPKAGKLILRGEFGWADKATENKRRYPSQILLREFSRLNEAMGGRRLFGELDHPSDARTMLRRVSHIITNLELTPEGIVVGEAEVLPTESGKVLEALLRAGCQIGVSSRGFGSTKLTEDGIEEVQEDFQLVTYDAVADPAASTAYPSVYYEWVQRLQKESNTMDKSDTPKEQDVQALVAAEVSKRETAMKEKFTSEMKEMLLKLEADLRERVRSELMTDPEVAGAKTALDSIKNALRPFVVSEDVSKAVAEKDKEIASLHTQLKAKDEEMDKLRQEMSELADVAKEAGYRYFLERTLVGNADADLIRKSVGDVKQYATAEELKAKVEAVQKVIERRKEEHRKAEEAAEAQRKTYETQVEALKVQNEKLSEGLKKALAVAKKTALVSYAESRQAGSSQREKVRAVVEASKATTEAEVDALLESIGNDASKYQNENVRARVKRLTGAGVESSPLEEEKSQAPARDGKQGYNELGVDLAEIQELAGLNA